MYAETGIIILLLAILAAAAVRTGRLTMTGGVTGWVISALIFAGTGVAGVVMLAVFFIAASVATRWKYRMKLQLGVAEKRMGRRNAWQVIANGGIPGLSGLVAWFFPGLEQICLLMVAGSFAAATADTLSSELGSLYGKKFYNILNLRREARGLDGVISTEGTLVGIFGSMLIAVVYSVSSGWAMFVSVIIAGTAGNVVDSLLGATAERAGLIRNNGVNFLNTLTGALVALLLYSVSFSAT
ncbi:MAG TPA: DUF92 domain-containing protein [Flavisolibacter sp.]